MFCLLYMCRSPDICLFLISDYYWSSTVMLARPTVNMIGNNIEHFIHLLETRKGAIKDQCGKHACIAIANYN